MLFFGSVAHEVHIVPHTMKRKTLCTVCTAVKVKLRPRSIVHVICFMPVLNQRY